MIDLDNVINNIGKEFEMYDKDGKALACALPIYLMYPNIPRFQYPSVNNHFNEVLDILKSHCEEITLEEINVGDILVFKLPMNIVHLAVYIGDGQIVHVMNEDGLQRCELSFFIKRIKGVFRIWEHHFGDR